MSDVICPNCRVPAIDVSVTICTCGYTANDAAAEIAALRAEVERLAKECDEARASLASAEDSLRGVTLELDRTLAECTRLGSENRRAAEALVKEGALVTRLRAEGAARERVLFALKGQIPADLWRWSGGADLRPSPAPSPDFAPSPLSVNPPTETNFNFPRAPIPKEEAPRCLDCGEPAALYPLCYLHAPVEVPARPPASDGAARKPCSPGVLCIDCEHGPECSLPRAPAPPAAEMGAMGMLAHDPSCRCITHGGMTCTCPPLPAATGGRCEACGGIGSGTVQGEFGPALRICLVCHGTGRSPSPTGGADRA